MSKNSSHRRSGQAGVPALDWLTRHPQGSQLLNTAHELLALEAALAGTLPGALARRVRVAQRAGSVLTVMVPTAAHAARLRQMLPAAVRRLQEAGWPVEDIVLRIDARESPGRTKVPMRETENLAEPALRSFAALRSKVAPGPLADAIERLLRHHQAGSPRQAAEPAVPMRDPERGKPSGRA